MRGGSIRTVAVGDACAGTRAATDGSAVTEAMSCHEFSIELSRARLDEPIMSIAKNPPLWKIQGLDVYDFASLNGRAKDEAALTRASRRQPNAPQETF